MDREKELENLVSELRERLKAVRELAREMFVQPNKCFPEANRILIYRDYKDYLDIDKFMEENNCSKITTYQLQRYVCKNRNYREIEVMLWNLRAAGLIELTPSRNHLVISIVGGTPFKLQKKRNSRGE